MMKPARLFTALATSMTLALGTLSAAAQEKVAHLPIRTDGPKVLDPVQGSTTYDNMACVQVYETLLENKYTDPMQMQPLLLAEMPVSEDGGKTWKFKLKEGVFFHDDECFTGGKGRQLVTDDVFYSLKRHADPAYEYENWWLLENTIMGFDEYKRRASESGQIDYDEDISGFRKISDHEFEIELVEPVYRFLYILSMFQTAIVPREAVEFYGQDFAFHPVGTGPFILEDFVPKKHLYFVKNPNYHEAYYPEASEWSSEDRRNRMHRAGGQRIPFLDRLEMTMYVQDNPMWLRFKEGELGYTQVPAESFEEAFDSRTKQLKPEWRRNGYRSHTNALLDFIFRGFNMEDELLGGYTEDKKALRQAINLAMNLDEFSDTFYEGNTVQYDGPIPPGLDGHPEGGRAPVSYRGPNREKARQKLAEAGYPNGEGLPTIKFYTSSGANNAEQVELMKRQLAEVGIVIDPVLVDFSTLIEFINTKKAAFFGFAWSSDYPDAENNLALFYGPNEAPGSNHYNYKNAEFDKLYEQIRTMGPSEERTELYVKMRDMIIEDAPFVGSMARQRYYLINPWLLNCKPSERYYSWYKYLDVDNSKKN